MAGMFFYDFVESDPFARKVGEERAVEKKPRPVGDVALRKRRGRLVGDLVEGVVDVGVPEAVAGG